MYKCGAQSHQKYYVLAPIGYSGEVQNCLRSNNGKLPYLQTHPILGGGGGGDGTTQPKKPQNLQGFTEDYYILYYNTTEQGGVVWNNPFTGVSLQPY